MKTGLVVIVVVMALVVCIQTDTIRTLMEEVKKEKNDIITKEEVKIAAGTEVQDNSGTSGKTATGSADEANKENNDSYGNSSNRSGSTTDSHRVYASKCNKKAC